MQQEEHVMADWYEQATFWETLAPVLFTEAAVKGAESEIDRVLKLAKVNGPSTILDMTCGVGRHAIPLAQKGHRVVGVDRTPSFLTKAKDAASKAGCTVEWVESDMRNFERKDTFDVALVLWNTFGYFADPADDDLALRRLHASLKTGGCLIMQVISKEHIARRSRRGGRDWFEKNGYLELIERRIAPDWGSEETRVIIISDEGKSDLTFTTRLYSGVEMSKLLNDAGFASCEIYSNLDGAPYNTYTGQHDTYEGELVVVATK
jgi:SAM-dependent methyltransferase